MTHWAEAYLGTPWVARTGECWQFAARVWREVFGWDVDLTPSAGDDPRAARRLLEGHPERARWAPTTAPVDGCAVVMARGARPCHVGVWVAPSAILHAIRGPGALCTPAHRIGDLGYRVTGLYLRVPA